MSTTQQKLETCDASEAGHFMHCQINCNLAKEKPRLFDANNMS